MPKRFLKFLILLLVLALALVALFASELLPPTRPEHREALAFLGEPEPIPEGRSAFAVFWFLGYDLAGRDPDQLMRQDMDAFAASLPDAEGFQSVADGLATINLAEEELCTSFPEPCLPYVRALPDAGAAIRSTYQDQLRASDSLLAADHYAYPFPLDGPLQVPRMGRSIGLRRFANAQGFVAGDHAGALANSCLELSAWRRLRPTANLLIHDMIAIAFAQTQAGLVAEMLAEWPADQPLPETCSQALAPLAEAELDQCPTWRGEAAFMRGAAKRGDLDATVDRPLPDWVYGLLLNRRIAVEFQAPELAAGCNGFRRSAPVEPGWMEWTFDPAGTVLREVNPGASVSRYHDRHLDHLDVLRTLRILAWLRGQPDRAQAWDALPAGLAPAPERLAYDAAGDRLVLTLRREVDGSAQQWSIPLPPALPTRAAPG